MAGTLAEAHAQHVPLDQKIDEELGKHASARAEAVAAFDAVGATLPALEVRAGGPTGKGAWRCCEAFFPRAQFGVWQAERKKRRSKVRIPAACETRSRCRMRTPVQKGAPQGTRGRPSGELAFGHSVLQGV